RLSEVRDSIAAFSYELDNWELDENSNDFTALKGILQHYEKISNALGEMGSFANGLASADVTDQKAMQNLNAVANLRKDLSSQKSEEHTSELRSRFDLVCRLLLEKK